MAQYIDFPGGAPYDPLNCNFYGRNFQEYYYDGTNAYTNARNLTGRVTCIKYKTDGQWSYTYYSYNDQGLIEWIVQNNLGLEKKIEYEYDAQGNVIKIVFDRTGTDPFFQWNEYNVLGQLYQIKCNTINTIPTYAKALYTYWPSGTVKTLKLGQSGPSDFAEVLEYTYNVCNRIVSINAGNGVEMIDPSNPSTNFAMKLYYNTGDGIPYYNGNISVADYFTYNPQNPHSPNAKGSHFHRYFFEYDRINRIKEADYKYATSGAIFAWINTSNAFSVTNIEYDNIGNIDTLTRKDETGSGVPFYYNYDPGTNRLDWVQNYNSQSSNNYDYDANGNLIKDVSKDISGTYIQYDYRNLPISLEFNNGDVINYGYDNNDNRVFKQYTPGGGAFGPSGNKYIYDANGRTLAVYDLNGQLKFINIYGLDLIGKQF